ADGARSSHGNRPVWPAAGGSATASAPENWHCLRFQSSRYIHIKQICLMIHLNLYTRGVPLLLWASNATRLPHEVDHPRTSQDRPDRLSVAHYALYRQGAGIPLCPRSEGLRHGG